MEKRVKGAAEGTGLVGEGGGVETAVTKRGRLDEMPIETTHTDRQTERQRNGRTRRQLPQLSQSMNF